jgi:Na+/melibiose symporter-like transporter
MPERSSARREGVLFAGLSFSFKLARAAAIQLAGIATTWVGLAVGAAPEDVLAAVSNGVALLYAAPVLAFTALSLGLIRMYRLSESRVREIQGAIGARRGSGA